MQHIDTIPSVLSPMTIPAGLPMMQDDAPPGASTMASPMRLVVLAVLVAVAITAWRFLGN